MANQQILERASTDVGQIVIGLDAVHERCNQGERPSAPASDHVVDGSDSGDSIRGLSASRALRSTRPDRASRWYVHRAGTRSAASHLSGSSATVRRSRLEAPLRAGPAVRAGRPRLVLRSAAEAAVVVESEGAV